MTIDCLSDDLDSLSLTNEFMDLLNNSMSRMNCNTCLVRTLYESGEQKALYIYDKNKGLNGPSKVFYKSGSTLIECTFANDKMEGPVKMFYESKAILAQYTCVHDNKHGLFTEWYESGKKRRECTYENGIMHGRDTWWHWNGEKIMECMWVNGREVE